MGLKEENGISKVHFATEERIKNLSKSILQVLFAAFPLVGFMQTDTLNVQKIVITESEIGL